MKRIAWHKAVVVLLLTLAACDDRANVQTTCEPECVAPTPACDEANDTCVGCLQNTDCQDPTASRCGSDHSCQPCGADTDCAHLGNLDLCIDGRCGECTIDTEADQCGDNSCNPATLQCTDTERGTVGVCEPCMADSECEEPDTHRCVPMHFKGTSRASGYCLEIFDVTCPLPYGVQITDSSLSGASEDAYCGVNQDLTTCEAVNAGSAANPCEEDDECGADSLDDGLCRTIGVVKRCTYECSLPEECPSGRTCNATPDPDYCDNPT